MHQQLVELRALAARAGNRKTETGIPRVAMVQGQVPEHELAACYDPMINLILQGSKSMTVGSQTLHYDPATYFVMSVDLPAVGAVHPSVSGAPYLAVSLTLDPTVIGTLLSDLPPPAAPAPLLGFSVAAVTPDLLDAWVRMLRLMDRPGEIPALAPAYEREILYRVLQGPHAALLRDIATPSTALARINLAIQWIRRHFAEPLRVETLAASAAMSPSAFHRHFKSVTALSPLQYQKRIRLLQARLLLVSGGLKASDVAFDVGYESATQFSREYARFFGAPPAKDAARIFTGLQRPGGLQTAA
ncbi:AraC family transcriptional regulator [Methylorubrum extorquens]|jgi:AraC-like DNA-binding protein|uniref:Helix-turn-helix, AraC type:AraC-type transcriptional regulator n=2 Tax=Methylorubrum extorquens TaxID=408 RepID=C5B695_METEA|nr:AraC family transcriptional regulator [Methylorubrum extorquens]ACS43977.1 Helix-turn-helix, AraC type:AraC-type transcriptional regulator [Methylorubrum extorquens AM1]EHP95080.1 transcriptional regulator, AraC family [Methylorubrum extorquens DSM 13060]MCP1546162.1 AraC-like DNA-binding protein [Methylorubrum extorquens]MCP1590829.1 AraC-like DNA-binding protein [Methylorubrum extorquens]